MAVKGCKIFADLDDVFFKATEIIVPDRVRQTGKTVTVTVIHKDDERYKTTMQIKLRKYEMTFEDDFDTYNKDIWTPRHDGAKVPMAFTKVKEDYVRDGNLCLDFEKNDTPTVRDGNECYYSDAGVITKGKFSQKYGCFTAKMKHPYTPKGTFTAFWLLPEDANFHDVYFFKRTDTGNEFHGCAEIDIMEIFHDPDTRGSSHTEHYWDPTWTRDDPITKSSLGEDYTIPGFQYGQYQEYSCVWNEYGLYYYVNGELAKANTNIEPVEDVKPAYILFTCYIGPKGSGATWGEVDDKDLPQTLYVDWVRVYK